MKGFIEITVIDNLTNEYTTPIQVHYSQIYFVSNYAKWNNHYLKESKEEILNQIHQTQQ